MDKGYKRHNRRSHPNLQLFTVKPLTTIPLNDELGSGTGEQDIHIGQSYLASRSLPQTPSILSRSSSRSRSVHRLSSRSVHTFSELNEDIPGRGDIARSHHRNHSRGSRVKISDNRDWWLQTASTLATSTAESKGQVWLATRSSSTSLVNAPYELPESAYRADDEFSPISVRHTSRPQSRLGSRHGSRRGSKVGLFTPIGIQTPGERDRDDQSDYFGSLSVDFADSELASDDSAEEENEVKQLVWGRARGWVDWAVGWLDFRGDDEEYLDGEDDLQPVQPIVLNTGLDQSKRHRKRVLLKKEDTEMDGHQNALPAPKEGGGIISDAAWLLGAARLAL